MKNRVLTGSAPVAPRVDRAFPTDERAKPAHPDDGIASDASGRDLVLLGPVVDYVPVEVREERFNVGRAVGLVVDEVGVLVDVERDERRGVPDREGVLRVADVVE